MFYQEDFLSAQAEVNPESPWTEFCNAETGATNMPGWVGGQKIIYWPLKRMNLVFSEKVIEIKKRNERKGKEKKRKQIDKKRKPIE